MTIFTTKIKHMIQQKNIIMQGVQRGYHLVTGNILSELGPLPESGLLNLFIQHTSAALTINENADPSVRVDFEAIMNALVPEDQAFYTHTLEGSDDMPAHIKASLLGPSLTIPISNHRLCMGTWQGIYLCEFRDYGGSRRIVATIYS